MVTLSKKILITGGAGFVGSHTAKALVNAGAKVVIVDSRLPAGAGDKRIKFYNVDIGSPKLDEVFSKERPSVVYHFAYAPPDHKLFESSSMRIDDIISGLNLLNVCRKYRIKKIIFLSTGFLYGNAKNIPIKESEPLIPISPYMVNKVVLENYLSFYKKNYNLPYVILRCPTLYGPGQTRGVVSDYIKKLAAGRQAEIFGDGKKTRDFLYIEDLVGAILMATDLPDDFDNPVFNVGSGRETTLNEVYKTVALLLKKESKPVYFPDKPGEQARLCLDCSKIKRAMGWKPHYNLAEGLENMLEAEKLI